MSYGKCLFCKHLYAITECMVPCRWYINAKMHLKAVCPQDAFLVLAAPIFNANPMKFSLYSALGAKTPGRSASL